jgi:hypothetical protein
MNPCFEKLNKQREIYMVEEQKTTNQKELAHNLSTVGWSFFFIWIGLSFLANFGVGLGLLGIGIITLGIQLVRLYYSLKLEGFWIVVGLLFVLGGFGYMWQINIPLIPIVLILAGFVLLYSIIKGKK